MSRKWFNGKVPYRLENKFSNNSISKCCHSNIELYIDSMNNLAFKTACESILEIATKANIYLNESQPWLKIKTESEKKNVSNDLYIVLEAIRIIGLLGLPVVPHMSKKILEQLGLETNIKDFKSLLVWGKLESGVDLPQPIPVISKLDI